MSRPWISNIYGYYPGFEEIAQALDDCADDEVFCDNCSLLLECRRWFDETVCQPHSPARGKQHLAEYIEKITQLREMKKVEVAREEEDKVVELSVKETADLLEVGINQIYRYCRCGVLLSSRNGDRGKITVLLKNMERIDAAPVL